MEQRVHCIIRNSGSGWHIIDDADHQPIGVAGISQFSDHLQLNFSFTAKKVHGFSVSPDETYGCLDQVSCGASVGLNSADLYLARVGVNGKVDPASVAQPWGNFFVSGLFSL